LAGRLGLVDHRLHRAPLLGRQIELVDGLLQEEAGRAAHAGPRPGRDAGREGQGSDDCNGGGTRRSDCIRTHVHSLLLGATRHASIAFGALVARGGAADYGWARPRAPPAPGPVGCNPGRSSGRRTPPEAPSAWSPTWKESRRWGAPWRNPTGRLVSPP